MLKEVLQNINMKSKVKNKYIYSSCLDQIHFIGKKVRILQKKKKNSNQDNSGVLPQTKMKYHIIRKYSKSTIR